MSFSEEKRKKLIVPAVALMICAVAMIGIGYAAVNSSIINSGNTMDEDFTTISIYNSSTGGVEIKDPFFKETCTLSYATEKYNQYVDNSWVLNTKYKFDVSPIDVVEENKYYLMGDHKINGVSSGGTSNLGCIFYLSGADVIDNVTVTLKSTSEETVTFTFNNVTAGLNSTTNTNITNGTYYAITVQITPSAEYIGDYSTPEFSFKFTI